MDKENIENHHLASDQVSSDHRVPGAELISVDHATSDNNKPVSTSAGNTYFLLVDTKL